MLVDCVKPRADEGCVMADQSAEFVENCGFELPREYKPPEGYRLLQIGEVVQKDDIFLAVNGEHWPAKRIGEAVNNNRYLRRIEVEQAAVPEPESCGFEGHILREVSQPCAPCDSRDTGDMTTSEQIAEIEGQAAEPDYTLPEGCRNDGGWLAEAKPQPVQVCEGRWRTRGGEIRNVTLTPAEDLRAITYPWHDARYGQTWLLSGRYNTDHTNSELDLVDYLGPIEPGPEQQPEQQQAPQAESDAEREIRALHEIVDAQAETISRLHNEIRDLHNEIGGLQRKQAAAVEAADKQNASLREQLDAATAELQKRHPDHIGRAISTDEWMDQFARDASVSRLQADRNDLAGKVVTLREQLQQANDRVAYLEALLPVATAYTTAQTMVRDMLGHMRCLMALQHTTDRRNFCTLLESILEVFDEAECGDGDADADDTSDTSDTDTTKPQQG